MKFIVVTGLVISALMSTVVSANKVNDTQDITGYFQALKKTTLVTISQPSNPGLWSLCHQQARITSRQKLSDLKLEAGAKVMLTTFRFKDRRCYFNELTVMENEPKEVKRRPDIAFKPHVAEGYFYGYLPRQGFNVNLDPRITFATDDKDERLKCRSFRMLMPARLNGTSRIPEREIELAELFASWHDYARMNKLVRLEGVTPPKDHPSRPCTFEKLVTIDLNTKKIEAPVKPKVKFIVEKIVLKNYSDSANNSYKTCLKGIHFPFYNSTRHINLLDYCGCYASAYRDFPVDSYNKSRGNLRNNKDAYALGHCKNEQIY